MKPRKKYGKVASALAMAVVLIITALPTVAAAQSRGRDRAPRNSTPAVATSSPAATNTVDEDFVRMMIPHHHQAVVMGQLAATRAGDQAVRSLASRIQIEQTVEINMMQNWQTWNGLAVTNAEQAYQMMLGNPAMLEQMGMATPAEMDALSASSGTAFDQLYLELMIEHHEGAVTMLVDVIINGDDFILQYWATDMMTAQNTQIWQMEQMLDDIG